MHPLHAYLKTYASTSITDEDFQFIESHFTNKKIRKRQYFLEEGGICKYFAFIIKGAMRKYYLDDQGKEHVVDLYVEHWWAGDRESYVMLTPSIYYIEAWEDCELMLITNENKIKLCSQLPSFNEFLLRLDEKNNIATQKRITSAISSSAKVRYDDFANSYPEFLQRFPQHVIASYLGISKETLSRVRSQVS
ncbi:Crp/Fnr family transcriptional regulator [Flavitalea antarctica]